ncbi:hypothetical protein L3X38_027737 [Prunus dulcis]|uniref:Uncharacterized protein n=1 Tax=Prunus dulcis TaxID=3755 RepID=A0AAD4VNH5_PRUDU|nr:hypothetical protein L3X38_027737 [Prunus dulcis]
MNIVHAFQGLYKETPIPKRGGQKNQRNLTFRRLIPSEDIISLSWASHVSNHFFASTKTNPNISRETTNPVPTFPATNNPFLIFPATISIQFPPPNRRQNPMQGRPQPWHPYSENSNWHKSNH